MFSANQSVILGRGDMLVTGNKRGTDTSFSDEPSVALALDSASAAAAEIIAQKRKASPH